MGAEPSVIRRLATCLPRGAALGLFAGMVAGMFLEGVLAASRGAVAGTIFLPALAVGLLTGLAAGGATAVSAGFRASAPDEESLEGARFMGLVTGGVAAGLAAGVSYWRADAGGGPGTPLLAKFLLSTLLGAVGASAGAGIGVVFLALWAVLSDDTAPAPRPAALPADGKPASAHAAGCEQACPPPSVVRS
jgi:hypothetical protein